MKQFLSLITCCLMVLTGRGCAQKARMDITAILGLAMFAMVPFSLRAQQPDIAEAPAGDTNSYALLYVYRPDFLGGSMVSYNVYVNDSLLCRVKNNSKFVFKLYHEGLTKVSAKAGKPSIVILNVKYGENYYIYCSLDAGFPHSIPNLLVKDESIGSKEFDMVKGRKNKKSSNSNSSNHD